MSDIGVPVKREEIIPVILPSVKPEPGPKVPTRPQPVKVPEKVDV